jgi:hypothetical protein
MKPITINVKNQIGTYSLSFELAPQIQRYLANTLDECSKPESKRECVILFPDDIFERGSLLSLVTLIRIDNQEWEILNIAIYEIIEEGQETKFLGRVDGQYLELDVMGDSVNRQQLISRWEKFTLAELNGPSELSSFNKQHWKLLRHTGHEVLSNFEEQKPELCSQS